MNAKRQVEPTDDDVAWTEERTIALMQEGVPFARAVEIAAHLCTERILEREMERALRAFQALERERERQRKEREKRDAADHADHRAVLEAKATLAQRPTLKATLGDLLAMKRKGST
jgi:hypothetical protein